jgi:phage recombination protein Bet
MSNIQTQKQSITQDVLQNATATQQKDTRRIVRETILKDFGDDDAEYFFAVCEKLQLDPLTKQVHPSKHYDTQQSKYVLTIVVGIDGLRSLAERTGEYEGQTQVAYFDTEGKEYNVWTDLKMPPWAAKVGIYRKGFRDALYATALTRSYAQRKKDGGYTKFWAQMPEVMIAKVAEACALRKAFPQALSSLYVREEIAESI